MRADGIFARRMTRRTFLTATGVTLGGAALMTMGADCSPMLIRRVVQSKSAAPPHHRAWVWQFSVDGDPAQIASQLASDRLGVMVKTHDGTDWMSKYDHHPSAVSSAAQVRTLAQLFESRGVRFHAWCVIKGIDPVAEAQMAADVLAAGARSLTLDFESGAGFWVGSADAAVRFGNELRGRSAYGRVDLSIDPRPWRINLVPMDAIMPFMDGIAPQLYWESFASTENIERYAASGYRPPTGTITPEFLVDATRSVLAKYDREVIPAGQGASNANLFGRFVREAWAQGMGQVSSWRYGVTPAATFAYLGQNPAGIPPAPPPPIPSPTATRTGTPTKTATGTRTPTRTATPAGTSTPANTPFPTNTATPTDTAIPTFTATPTPV